MSIEDRVMFGVFVVLSVTLGTGQTMWLVGVLGEPVFFSSTAFVCVVVGGLAVLNYYRRQP